VKIIGIITSLVRMQTEQVNAEKACQELAAVGKRIEMLRPHEQGSVAGGANGLRLRPSIVQLADKPRAG
jgi:hypothetical protein